MGRKGKSTEGRKKVEMKKIESDDARQVSFSKRKKGVFAKACELSTMCGAEVAVLLYSPSGTPHSFGSPSVDKVFAKFLTGEQFEYSDSDANMVNAINQLNQEYMQLTQMLEASNGKREALEERIKKTGSEAKECQWLDKIDELSRDELLQLLGSLYRVKCSVNERMRALSLAGNTGAGPSNNMDISNTGAISLAGNTGAGPSNNMDISNTGAISFAGNTGAGPSNNMDVSNRMPSDASPPNDS